MSGFRSGCEQKRGVRQRLDNERKEAVSGLRPQEVAQIIQTRDLFDSVQLILVKNTSAIFKLCVD
jgi:hypothetical protein